MLKIRLILLVFFLNLLFLNAEKDIAAAKSQILYEGRLLYNLEICSEFSQKLLLQKSKESMSKVAGYFTFLDSSGYTCIFYDNSQNAKVIAELNFDKQLNSNTVIISTNERAFNPDELDLFQMRTESIRLLLSDTLFKSIPKTKLKLIPLKINEEKKVYVISVPEDKGKVLFGNDYLITFSKDNKASSKRKLHQKATFIDAKKVAKAGEIEVVTDHIHYDTQCDFICPSDVCTLLLNANEINWKQHNVYSKDYVTMWNCKKKLFEVLQKDIFEKIINSKK